MPYEVEISEVIFKIGGKKIELTLSEAKKLQALLNNNFGVSAPLPYVPPIIIDRFIPFYPDPYRWNDWRITYTNNNTQTSDGSGGTLYCSC